MVLKILDHKLSKMLWHLYPTWFLLVNSFCTYVGVMMVFTHQSAYAVTVGMSVYQGSYLLSFVGFGNLFGRILSGFAVMLPFVSEENLLVFEFVVCGVIIAVIPLTNNFILLACISTGFGLIYGSMCAILPQIVINVLELQQLTTG